MSSPTALSLGNRRSSCCKSGAQVAAETQPKGPPRRPLGTRPAEQVANRRLELLSRDDGPRTSELLQEAPLPHERRRSNSARDLQSAHGLALLAELAHQSPE